MPSWNPRMTSGFQSPPSRRWQFSIRITLLAVTMCALAVAFWKAFVWQPPTHGIALYEKASAFYGRTAKIGPNQIRIESVARNDRDGAIRVESGRGQPLDVSVVGERMLVNCAPWLDVAQIELQPGGDLLDIIEVRIFDHSHRELLSRLDPAYGWNVVSPNVLQVYGLNQTLPERLDVWLRVNSYSADDDVYKLPPTAGATVDVNGTTLTLHQTQAGFRGWSSKDGFIPVQGGYHADSAYEIRWEPSNDDRRYQIAAVTRDGEWTVDNHLYAFHNQQNEVIMLPVALESVDHLEIRPFGGRHSFYFDGVRIPKATSSSPFAASPTAIVQVGGVEIAKSVPEFLPLDVRVRLVDGKFGSGSTAGGTWRSLIPKPDGPTERGNAFSLIIDERGIGEISFQFRLRRQGSWMAGLNSSRSAQSSGASGVLIERNYQVPIEMVDQIEITVTPAP
jgi:hypothetical protein